MVKRCELFSVISVRHSTIRPSGTRFFRKFRGIGYSEKVLLRFSSYLSDRNSCGCTSRFDS